MGTKYKKPVVKDDIRYRFDSFENGAVLFGRKGRLPAMGWNSWNAFGSGNTEALTKAMAEKMVELGLDRLGYKYVVLDDGCYNDVRVDGHVMADPVKFPGGFKEISDFIHNKGLKFGMYNDVGCRLCSGLKVGTIGFEDVDTADYVKWGVDYIKVDNCYNVWDNATFSKPDNARFTFAPAIKGIQLRKADAQDIMLEMLAVKDGIITGNRAFVQGEYVTGIGTFDGTGPDASPVGDQSSELRFKINVPESGEYILRVFCKAGCTEGVGQWLQVAVGTDPESVRFFYDDLINDEAEDADIKNDVSVYEKEIMIELKSGENILRLMNHRRQENTLTSYARIQEGFEKTGADRDVVFSICEWGKTQPQNWGYKVGDSWRILNDITFQVGSDGDSGHASWEGAYTTSVTSQYNKAVIMDEFAGLDKGWNDPDMLMIGMDGLDDTMCKTHMTMWCMMNSPLMLGMDLRNVEKDDEIYRIISKEEIIALNQDSLGVQAKRIYTTKAVAPDTSYIRDNDRIDVLAKPLSDGSIALSFINVGMGERSDGISIDLNLIREYIGHKMVEPEKFFSAEKYEITDVWSGQKKYIKSGLFSYKIFGSDSIAACDNITIKISPSVY